MEVIRVFPIGDTHLCTKHIDVSRALVAKIISIAERSLLNVIVHLGDVFDRFGTIDVETHALGIDFIVRLSKIAPVLLIIGNHDRKQSSKSFLSTIHFFNGLKQVPNIYIADVGPTTLHFDDMGNVTSNRTTRHIIGVPYVPVGEFSRVLETAQPSISERAPLCVFAHQEMAGCIYNGNTSTKGDTWHVDAPLLVCGHIHERQHPMPNLLYVGSSRQVSTDEAPNKSITLIDFDPDETLPTIHKPIMLRVGMLMKLTKPIDELSDYEPDKNYKITLHVHATMTQFRSPRYLRDMQRLSAAGVVIKAHNVTELSTATLCVARNDDDSYKTLLSLLSEDDNASACITLLDEVMRSLRQTT